MLGSTRELCVFDFGTFRIGRYLTVTALSVEEEILEKIKVKEVEEGQGRQWRQIRSEDAISKMVKEKERQVVRGIQPIRTPFFLQKRLEHNSVPKYLWTIVEKKDEADLLRRHPGIGEDLRIENYMVHLPISATGNLNKLNTIKVHQLIVFSVLGKIPSILMAGRNGERYFETSV